MPFDAVLQQTLATLCVTPTVLVVSHQHHITNVASPSLHRKAATNNMLQIIEAHPNWPVYADVLEHPHSQIASRRPIWSDMTFVDTITQEREDWSSASVVNQTIVTDPTISDSQVSSCMVSNFWTGQGPCRDNLHKWGLTQSPSCDCGEWQTVNHIVDTCPLTKFEGGLNLLHKADDDTVTSLESTVNAALTK